MEHVPFNAALLRTIRFAFPDDKIRFYAEESHSDHVREQIGPKFAAGIVWEKLVLPARHASFYSRLPWAFKTAMFLLNSLNEDPQKNVLVITGNASVLWALKFYLKSSHKDKKVQVVIHGDFSTLRRTPRRSILNPLYYPGSLKTALRMPGHDRLQHIVLEEPIRDEILKCMPFLRDSIGVLDHPIPPDDHDVESNEFTMPIQFGFLGRATEKKDFRSI